MATGGLKRGEKVLFSVVGLLGVMAVISFIGMEIYRSHLNHPMYADATHFDFSEEGSKGSEIFRHDGCTACHRAVRNGTNMGLDLDGIGSKRSLQYLVDFLKNPEVTYASVTNGAQTVDHGPGKAAQGVANLPESERHALAVFLSELRANRGSPDAPLPPKEQSSFIDAMVKEWAPDWWKKDHKDIRTQAEQTEPKKEEPQSATGK